MLSTSRLAALFSLFLLVSVGGVAQKLDESPTNIENALTDLLSNLQALRTRLAERSIELKEARKQLETLREELTEAQRSLTTSREHLSASRQEIERLTESLTLSRETLNELDESFKDYQTEATRRVRRWQIATAAAVVVAVLSLLR